MKNSLITHAKAEHKFKIVKPEGEAYLEYAVNGNDFVVLHTIVPGALGGNGYGGMLAQEAFEYASEQRYAFKYECSFIGKWSQKNNIPAESVVN